MTCNINADTSDGLKIVSDTSGTVDIQSNGTTKMSVGTTIDVQGNDCSCVLIQVATPCRPPLDQVLIIYA